MTDQLLIILALCIPTVAAILIAVTHNNVNLRETGTLLSSVCLIFVVYNLLQIVLAGDQPQLFLLKFLPGLAIHFKIEPLGMLFACIASFLWLINSIYSIGYMRGNNEKHQTRFYICFAVAIASTIGIAFSANLITLFIFYEALTLSTYPLVTHKGSEDAMRAGRAYLGILLSTSICFFLPAIIWTSVLAGNTEFTSGGILDNEMNHCVIFILLMLFSYGIGKAALMPMHRWLPAAMVAPTPVSALLHAVAVVKAGVFSIVKIVTYIFSPALLAEVVDFNLLLYLAGVTIIVASIIALQADNLKRRLAYSTISQLSYVILATALLAPISIMGAALHILAHAFGKITLFFAAGSIYTATKKTAVSELDGIGKVMPWTMGAFAIASLSMIGVPPTAGFLSKWYILQGAFSVESWFAITVIIISTLLNAGYFLPIVYAAFFKKPSDGKKLDYHEAPFAMVFALTVTSILTIVLFLFPEIPLQLVKMLVGNMI
ncbi:MAG: monovalent cation/H+ antiporter subunit D family protein [Proteobacteria bacterium]|nr:monovalent cation/H+ antiporter subunit D family protein [Pseudomonadota bacterium]NOG59509.1 monovalent cation/H+ antiporter subunit D family protein [Pseudomonadota bacterium]